MPEFLPNFRVTQADRIPADFHSQMVCGLLVLALCSGLEGGPLQLSRPSGSQVPHVCVGPACFASLPFLLVSAWLLYILSYRTYSLDMVIHLVL